MGGQLDGGKLADFLFSYALFNIFNAKYIISIDLECPSPITAIWLNRKLFLKQACQVLLEIMH